VPPAHPSVPSIWGPRFWVFHLVAVLCVGAAASLGFWQYDAWTARRAAEAEDLTLLDPVALGSLMGPDDPFPGDKVGHPVILGGTWVPEGTVFVSGREDDGRDGFWVVTPLEVGPGDSAMLVVRGWTPSPEDAPGAPTGPAELVGFLQPGEGTGAFDEDAGDDVIPQLRIADALQHVDQDLYGAYAVVADEIAPGAWPHGERALNDGTTGLEPASVDQLPEAGRFTALRNLLYAVEWWVFGLFAAFVWWRWVRDELDEDADDEAEAEASGSAP
jgi:surfeit locus 1 family protein